MGQMNNVAQIASETVEAIRRLSKGLPDDVRTSVFAEIARQLAPAKKRKPKELQERPALNALGKPMSPLYDPNYKMTHRVTPISRLSRPGWRGWNPWA
jgi:hypothetical protein